MGGNDLTGQPAPQRVPEGGTGVGQATGASPGAGPRAGRAVLPAVAGHLNRHLVPGRNAQPQQQVRGPGDPGARGQDGARGSLSAGRCRSDPLHAEHGAAAGATGPVTAEDRVRTRRPDKGPSAAGAASGDSWGGDTGARGSQGRAPRRSRPREGSPQGEAEGGRQHRGHDPRLAFGCPGARPFVWSSLRASRLPPGTATGTAPAPGPRPRGSEQPRAGAPGREQSRPPGLGTGPPPAGRPELAATLRRTGTEEEEAAGGSLAEGSAPAGRCRPRGRGHRWLWSPLPITATASLGRRPPEATCSATGPGAILPGRQGCLVPGP
ncbi:uncharacterized protein AAEQ78_021453 [Lycaon pictus]